MPPHPTPSGDDRAHTAASGDRQGRSAASGDAGAHSAASQDRRGHSAASGDDRPCAAEGRRPVLRTAAPADYDAIAAVVDDWWGRPILPTLPRLFLDHFHRTSLIAEAPSGGLAGFLIGFLSPSLPDEAYIHFVGVSPGARQSGLARTMYERFFDLARQDGRHVVRAITAPVNETSIAFHRRMGFSAGDPVPGYNGPGTSLVTFTRPL